MTRNQLNQRIRDQENRITDITNARGRMNTHANNHSGGGNNFTNASITQLIERLGSGLSRNPANNQLQTALNSRREGSVGSDTHLSSADSFMQQEINAANRRIADYQEQLRAL